MSRILVIDIEVHDEKSQAKYLVHGFDDIYWTDSVKEVMEVIKQSLEDIDAEAS